jgi:hypothetical protein
VFPQPGRALVPTIESQTPLNCDGQLSLAKSQVKSGSANARGISRIETTKGIRKHILVFAIMTQQQVTLLLEWNDPSRLASCSRRDVCVFVRNRSENE